MKKWWNVFWMFLIAFGCKKPFNPPASISADNRYLVIEGVINGNDSTFIKLSRTKKIDTLRTVYPEMNARISVESDANNSFSLTELTSGTYVAPPFNLDPAHKYRLRIKTSDNKEYLSDFVVVKNSPPIDSVGYLTQSDGLQLYVNTHDATNTTRYYRWEYREDWQFHSKYVSSCVATPYTVITREPDQKVYDCFGNDSSTNVLIASTTKLARDVAYQAPITKVLSTSEKIETKYSILVKQYALTSDAYTFWENLQKNTEKLGSIFDVLPSETQSNFHCITNPNELVIGYLSAGNVSSKLLYITVDQLPSTYTPIYPCHCELDTAFDEPDPHILTEKPASILSLPNSPYLPITMLYPVPDLLGLPYAYTYSTILCVDCTVRGKKTKPYFWK
ncbi:MAG: DUF4249 domain-containing protein [Mucilaginibacter sp.]